jgi:nicotinate-nucleotide adenylyltransferase
VVLMPTAQPPHKLKNGMASAAHRLAMCRLAVADCPFVTVSDWEIQKGGASFTVETLEYLCTAYPDTQWYLFVGADMFLSIDTWFRFADIARYAVLCAVPRDGVTRDQLCEKAVALQAQGARTVVADMVAVDISSTALRDRVMQKQSLGGLVPPAVEAYIMKHELYQDMSGAPATDEQIVEILRGRLKPKRFAHSLAVAQEAERLAAQETAETLPPPTTQPEQTRIPDPIPEQEPETGEPDFHLAAGIAGGMMVFFLIFGLIGVVKKENKKF